MKQCRNKRRLQHVNRASFSSDDAVTIPPPVHRAEAALPERGGLFRFRSGQVDEPGSGGLGNMDQPAPDKACALDSHGRGQNRLGRMAGTAPAALDLKNQNANISGGGITANVRRVGRKEATQCPSPNFIIRSNSWVTLSWNRRSKERYSRPGPQTPVQSETARI
jgi:hypothetical protein